MGKLTESQKGRIKATVADVLGIPPYSVKDDSDLHNDLGADSIDEMEIIMESEKMFEISIPDGDYHWRMNVGELYKIIEAYIP